jgi:hypothetical protein
MVFIVPPRIVVCGRAGGEFLAEVGLDASGPPVVLHRADLAALEMYRETSWRSTVAVRGQRRRYAASARLGLARAVPTVPAAAR